ncbi:hypothetical protein Goarm_022103 [Gossypium armourianum]|uniref:Uncharacterized protein n=1 Tax=Gossypium armourianum TaxID=34283 RepID=A0A7J9ITR3_9ROSI|nr:hypothetical protein [Gossypium armourianum]
MEIVKSILDIPVQDPQAEFSSADLTWKKFGTVEHQERGRKRSKGSLKEYKNDDYLEYKLYWCSLGLENYGEGGDILPSRKYRLNTRNRAARPQSMRGCTCHFVVKRLYTRPSLVLIIYNGIPKENVLGKSIECIQQYCGSDATFDTLASEYVRKLGMIIKRSTLKLDRDDQASIWMWVERNKKSIFFYQDTSEMDPFILGIQTEWQLQQMYPLCTLLVFDSRHHALPVAWIITPSVVKSDMSKWTKALFGRAQSIERGWKINGCD